jgi:hypothetical protein
MALTPKQEEIFRFLESLPEKFQILEQGFDIETQKEYLNYSHGFEKGCLNDQELEKMEILLFHPDLPLDGKKKALTILAHAGSIGAFKILAKYCEDPAKELKQWAGMALQECRMFLESELAEESLGFIMTGLGGSYDKLRTYLLVLPLEGKQFNKNQHKIIENELAHWGKKINCAIENFDFQEDYVGLTALIPMDIAIATFIEGGIKSCNEFGSFVLEDYYAGNVNIPDRKEIEEIIKIIRNG